MTKDVCDKVRTFFQDRKELLEPPDTKPLSVVTKHEIKLKPGAQPQYESPRRCGPAEMKELQRQIQYLLSVGYIRPSQSAWGAPIQFVPKPGGKLRMVTDFRKLNATCQKMNGGLPKIADIFDLVGQPKNKYFTKLDLRWGYWNVLLTEESQERSTISTPLGSYDFLVLQFGLNGAVSTFQNMMQQILRPFLTKFCMVYIDDVIIYSESLEEHLKHIELILDALNKARLKVNVRTVSHTTPSYHVTQV
jgi:hypothetical protein